MIRYNKEVVPLLCTFLQKKYLFDIFKSMYL